MLQDNFPERLGVIYICPVNMLLRAIWKMVQPMLNERTRRLVRLVGSCAELQKYIDADQLPTRMGGTDTWQFDPERDVPDLL